MFVVLFGVVAFFTNLLMEDFALFDSSCLFCRSEIATASCNAVSDIISKHNIAVAVSIQSNMSLLCCILGLLLDHCIRILLCTDDAMDALGFAGTAPKTRD